MEAFAARGLLVGGVSAHRHRFTGNMEDSWAQMLHSLSEKRSSIQAAATFALSKPEQAMELLAAIVARVQVHGP